MKKCHHDHDSHPVRDWSEVDSGAINQFLQVSTFKSITTTNIYHLYEVFFQKAHLLLSLVYREKSLQISIGWLCSNKIELKNIKFYLEWRQQQIYLMHLVSMYNKKWKKKENSVMNFQIPVNLNPVSHCKSSSQCHLKTDKDKAKAISHLSFAELQNGHRFCSLLGYTTRLNKKAALLNGKLSYWISKKN